MVARFSDGAVKISKGGVCLRSTAQLTTIPQRSFDKESQHACHVLITDVVTVNLFSRPAISEPYVSIIVKL